MDNDSTNQQPTDKPTGPVTFSAEQQAKIDEIVKSAMGRAASETRQQLEAEKQRAAQLEADLQTAQQALNITAAERDSEKTARTTLEQQAMKWRKDAYIAAKCVDFNFIDAPTVSALVEGDLVWNETTQDFVVIEQKAARVESDAAEDDQDDQSAPRPTTVEEFFSRFAQQKPYLVRSEVRTGSASQPSSQSSLPTGRQQYKVTDIFGRGSNSRLANELAQRNPEEYRRLKTEARNKRLI